jgi:hypothetical protein
MSSETFESVAAERVLHLTIGRVASSSSPMRRL